MPGSSKPSGSWADRFSKDAQTKTPPFAAGLQDHNGLDEVGLFLDFDLALHRWMQAADVVVDSSVGERQLGGLSLQRDRRALCLGAGDRHLVRRGIGVG